MTDLKILPECHYKPSYVKVMTIKPNTGVYKVDNKQTNHCWNCSLLQIFKIESAIYPPDNFKYMYKNQSTQQNINIPNSVCYYGNVVLMCLFCYMWTDCRFGC